MGGDANVSPPHYFDVALSGFTIENTALSLSLAGHPCCSVS